MDLVELVELVKKSINDAENEKSKCNEDVLSVAGMSSTKCRHLLNNLCSFPETVYLEIGTWKGSTIIAASYKNNGKFYCIDSWKSKFKQKENPYELFLENKEKFKNESNIIHFKSDSWEFDKSHIKEKVNIYFYDGDHTLEGTQKAFEYYDDLFEDQFVMLMDDWNRPHIRKSTNIAIKNYKIKFEQVFKTPNGKNDPHGEGEYGSMKNRTIDTWWNGLYLAVLEK